MSIPGCLCFDDFWWCNGHLLAVRSTGVLTVISTLFMPIPFVEGFFGMNFEGLPFANNWLMAGALGAMWQLGSCTLITKTARWSLAFVQTTVLRLQRRDQSTILIFHTAPRCADPHTAV